MKFFALVKSCRCLFPLFFLLGCYHAEPKQEYITIGALLPLTGRDADEGIRAYNGLILAREEINKNGGILGKKLDIIVMDDRGDAEFIVQQYKKLKEKNVAAVIGSSYSNATMALAKEAVKDGMPVISPTASDPEITIGRENIFRAIFIDDYQAEVLACFAYNSLKAKNALVLVNKNSANFQLITEIFTEAFVGNGGNADTEFFSTGDDFASILKKYTAQKPDLIFCPENFLLAAKLVNVAHNTGFNKTHLLGSDAWDGLLAYVESPDKIENVYYPTPFSFNDEDAKVVGFVSNYYNNYLRIPQSGSAAAYTSVYILAEAIKICKNTEKNALIYAIKTNETEQILGGMKFDKNNNPRTNVYVLHIEGGIYSTYEKLCLSGG